MGLQPRRKYILQFPWWRTRNEVAQILAHYVPPQLMPTIPTFGPQRLEVFWTDVELSFVELALSAGNEDPFSIKSTGTR